MALSTVKGERDDNMLNRAVRKLKLYPINGKKDTPKNKQKAQQSQRDICEMTTHSKQSRKTSTSLNCTTWPNDGQSTIIHAFHTFHECIHFMNCIHENTTDLVQSSSRGDQKLCNI